MGVAERILLLPLSKYAESYPLSLASTGEGVGDRSKASEGGLSSL